MEDSWNTWISILNSILNGPAFLLNLRKKRLIDKEADDVFNDSDEEDIEDEDDFEVIEVRLPENDKDCMRFLKYLLILKRLIIINTDIKLIKNSSFINSSDFTILSKFRNY